MEKKCDCYETKNRLRYTPFYNEVYCKTVGICNGTRERNECSCDGDRAKCDFYPEVRKKAKKELAKVDESSLIVTYDYCTPDVPTLTVARKEDDRVRVVNIIQGYAATNMYDHLTRGMGLIFDKSAKKPIGDLNSVPHYRCPSCNGAGVMYCDDHKYPCCQWCGQALDWK